jgi:hypothetical protein
MMLSTSRLVMGNHCGPPTRLQQLLNPSTRRRGGGNALTEGLRSGRISPPQERLLRASQGGMERLRQASSREAQRQRLATKV